MRYVFAKMKAEYELMLGNYNLFTTKFHFPSSQQSHSSKMEIAKRLPALFKRKDCSPQCIEISELTR